MCTGIRVMTQGDSPNTFFARTLEFGIDLKSRIIVKPAGLDQTADINGEPGKTWPTHFKYMGMDALGSGQLADGCNEAGLYVGGFYFPGYNHYPKVTDVKNSIGSLNFVDWCLSSFANVAAMREGLENNDAEMVNAVFEPLAQKMDEPTFVTPLHWIAVDKTGASIVVEYTKTGRRIYDNPYGVFTNAPDFEWMTTNIQNYANLSSFNVVDEGRFAKKVFGQDLTGFGQGSGMLGLPGDFTPPSRFIRALALSVSADPVRGDAAGVNQSWNLINNFNITKGNAREFTDYNQPDYTEWVAVYNLGDPKLYFRTYENPIIRALALSQVEVEGTYNTYPILQAPEFPNVLDLDTAS